MLRWNRKKEEAHPPSSSTNSAYDPSSSSAAASRGIGSPSQSFKALEEDGPVQLPLGAGMNSTSRSLYMLGGTAAAASSSKLSGSAEQARQGGNDAQQSMGRQMPPPASHLTSSQSVRQGYQTPPQTIRSLPVSDSMDTLASSSLPSQAQTTAPVNAASQQPQPHMGRSQSTFNFLLSKAKAPFSAQSQQQGATSQSQPQQQPYTPLQSQYPNHDHPRTEQPIPHSPLNASSSLSSLQSSTGTHTLDNNARIDSRGRNRAASNSSSTATPGNPSFDRSTDAVGMGRFGSSLRHTASEETSMPASSPTKRTIFGRERKVSTASVGRSDRTPLANVQGRNAIAQSPLSRASKPVPHNAGGGTMLPPQGNAFGNRSQSNLHEASSPETPTSELPPALAVNLHGLSASSSRGPFATGDSALLRSPDPHVSYSRSVDDLSRGHTPPPPMPPSPLYRQARLGGEGDATASGGTWGEQGVASNQSDRPRPSDVGTLRSDHRRLDRHGVNMASGSTEFSNMPSSSSSGPSKWLTSSRSALGLDQASLVESVRHERKGSKGAAMPTVRNEVARPPLPAGSQFDGLLNRNTQISLSIHQLNDAGSSLRGGHGREKDIGKGWKPFRVVLREGKLYFYKPPGAVSDDAKALFPTIVVPHSLVGADGGTSQGISGGLSIEDLQRNKISTKDLLVATSGNPPSSGPTPMRKGSSDARLSAIIDVAEPEPASETQTWERPGRHPDLVLVQSMKSPTTWIACIQTGTVDALSHEFVYATQSSGAPSSDETGAFLYAILLTLTRAARPLQAFLVSVHKWATLALGEQGNEEGVQVSRPPAAEVRARLHALVTCGLDRMVEEQSRASVLAMLEDIVRDNLAVDRDDAQANQMIADLRARGQASPETETGTVVDDAGIATFSAATLLTMDPSELARQIHAFYNDHVSPTTLELRQVLTMVRSAQSPSPVDLLSFDAARPHFLTRLVLEHVLGNEDHAQRQTVTAMQEAKQRAALLRHWIAVASYLVKLQNISAWVAICAALCSRAVARLTMTWRFVAASDRELVSQAWAPILVRLGWSELPNASIASLIDGTGTVRSSINGQQVTNSVYASIPYLGNALARVQASGSIGGSSGILPVHEMGTLAKQVWTTERNWHKEAETRGLGRSVRAIQAKDNVLQQTLRGLRLASRRAGPVDHNAALVASLQVEEAWLPAEATKTPSTHADKTLDAFALSPLAFNDALPHLTLVNPAMVVAAVKRTSRDPLAKTLTGDAAIESTPGQSDHAVWNRPRLGLSSSPLSRQSPFGPPTNAPQIRASRHVPFGDVVDWTSSQVAASTTSPDDMQIRIGEDLVLFATMDPPGSMPSSPMTGKRFSQEFTREPRPLSIASRRSSLPPSERNSMAEPLSVPLQVGVRMATLERLIDILTMDVQHLTAELASDEVLERIPLINKRSKLMLDMPHFRKTFLATFRIHCTPLDLFLALRKRLLSAVSAGHEMALPLPHRPHFPTWSRVESNNLPVQQVEWDVVAKVRHGIASLLSQWITAYPQDFVEDARLYEAVYALQHDLKGMHHALVGKDEGEPQRLQNQVNDLVKQLQLAAMTSQTEKRTAKRSSTRASKRHSGSTEVVLNVAGGDGQQHGATFDIDAGSPQDLVEYLESVVRVFFEKIEERDLLVVYDIFAKLAQNPVAWHAAVYQKQGQAGGTGDELPPINNMYKLLEIVRWPQDAQAHSLYQRLPSAVRDACASQSLLRGWCAVHIIEGRIGLARRQARIAKLLDAVWLCRARMLRSRHDDATFSPATQPAAVFLEPTLASFVESVLIGALTSSESRLFVRAWQQVAYERKGNCDALSTLVPSRETVDLFRDAATASSGTLDVGWLLRCLAQATLRAPMAPRSSNNESHSNVALLDFDRLRTVWALVDSSVGRIKRGAIEPNLVDLAGARLAAIQATLRSIQWDRRAFKEDNAIEAASVSPIPDRFNVMHGQRPLAQLMFAHQEKHRRDRLAYDLLVLHLEQEARQSITASTSQSGAGPLRAMQIPGLAINATPAQPASTGTTEKKTRRMTALFRGAVRPMNLMSTYASGGGGGHERVVSQDGTPRAFNEVLASIPLQKPSSTVTCGSSRSSIWRNGQRSFVLNLSPPEGGHVLLQAHSAAELYAWHQAIEKASREYPAMAPSASSADLLANTARRAPLPAGASGGASGKSSRAPALPLYGTDLKALAEAEGRSCPLGLARMLEQVEKRGLQEQGIYRISGAKSAIEALKQAFNTQPADKVNLIHGETSDVHTIAGAIKQWFRDLPEPVIPFSAYRALMEAERTEDEVERLYAIRDIIWTFPVAHFELLRRICEHLAMVCDEGQHNLMAPHNIGLVFGTSLLNPPPGPTSVAESFGNIGKAAHVVKIMVTTHDWLFEPEAEPEASPAAVEETDALATVAPEAEHEAPTDGPFAIDAQPEAVQQGAPEPMKEEHEQAEVGGDVETSSQPPESPVARRRYSRPSMDLPSEERHGRWLANPLVTVNEGTIDSHASESSILRAVMGIHMPKAETETTSDQTQDTSGSQTQGDAFTSVDTILQPSTSSTLRTIPSSASQHNGTMAPSQDRPATATSGDTQDEDLPHQRREVLHGAHTGGRERLVESVYLDATDAIAVLQNPFEEEEEGEEGEDVEEVEE